MCIYPSIKDIWQYITPLVTHITSSHHNFDAVIAICYFDNSLIAVFYKGIAIHPVKIQGTKQFDKERKAQ